MTAKGFREAMERGMAAHRAQRLDDALAAYRAALQLAPDDAEANSLTGFALAQAGRPAEALPLLRRAVELDGAQSGLRFNLAEGLALARLPDAALRELQRVVALEPQAVAAWSRIGDLEAQRGDDAAAAQAWSEAFELNPTLPRPAAGLAQLALRHGDTDRAISLLEVALSQSPGEPVLLGVLCEVLAARRDWPKLHATALAWADARPETPEAWRGMSRAEFERGRHADAVAAFARYLSLGRHAVGDLAAFAGLCLHALDFEAAEAALEAAEELEAGHPEVLARRALLHMYYGRFEAALDACRRCLEREPNNVPAYTILSRLQQGRLDGPQSAQLEAIAARADVPLDLRIPAAFSIAHALDASGGIDAAFGAYERAHELARERDRIEERSYSRAGQQERTQRLIELFPGPLAPSAVLQPGVRRPLFIVGMPRSGTTLVESVLGAHSRVHACGERLAMQQMIGRYVALAGAGRTPDDAALAGWASAYLAEVAAPAGKDHLTDKQPLNFYAVGLIARLFPDAVILHLRRDPLETLLSVWRQEFSKNWAFTHQLADLGHFFGEYARLMAHWERAFPGRIVNIRYEEFAGDFLNAAPALLRACGLEWEPACLEHARAERPIATFSTVDARAPVEVRSGRAERYRAHLAPLVDALREAGVDPTSGELSAAD